MRPVSPPMDFDSEIGLSGGHGPFFRKRARLEPLDKRLLFENMIRPITQICRGG